MQTDEQAKDTRLFTLLQNTHVLFLKIWLAEMY